MPRFVAVKDRALTGKILLTGLPESARIRIDGWTRDMQLTGRDTVTRLRWYVVGMPVRNAWGVLVGIRLPHWMAWEDA